MPFDVLHLHSPAGFIHPERLVAAFCGDLVEARFDDPQIPVAVFSSVNSTRVGGSPE